MNNNAIYKILVVLAFVFLCYSNIALAAKEENAYFHFIRKPEKEYPFELYVRYKPIQLVNSKGIELNLVYKNKANEANELVLDEDYCKIHVINNGVSVEQAKNREIKGLFKVLTEGFHPGDGKIIAKGKSKVVKINIDKITDKFKDSSPKDREEKFINITPSTYEIQLICIGVIYPGVESKIDRILLSVETDVFYITYKKSE